MDEQRPHTGFAGRVRSAVLPLGATLALAAGFVIGVPTVGTVGAVPDHDAGLPQAATPVVGPVLPVAYDPVAGYEAQDVCDPTPKPGTRALARLITRTYGRNQVVSISRACSVGGTSEHKEGRAADWMTNVRTRTGRANARACLAWPLGPDQAGVPHGNATRLGVMYIGWNDRFWAAYDADRGWTELKGCFATPGPASDTTCHRNHIHISLSWDGASGRTSLWDGTALAPLCSPPGSVATVFEGGRAADAIGVAPVRVLSTRDGLGLVAETPYGDEWGWPDDGVLGEVPMPDQAPAVPPPPCRLSASGWRGERAGIVARVVGQGGVPPTGVAAVVVTVTALGSTAPADIRVLGAGRGADVVVARGRMNGRAGGSAVVPVSSDGTIALATSAGATDVTVDVTGYFVIGDRPNLPAAVPSG